jgi:hypothetical protein
LKGLHKGGANPAALFRISTSAAEAAVATVSPMPVPTTVNQAAMKPSLEPIRVVAPRSMPAAMTVNPTATVIFTPTRIATRSDGTAPSTSPMITGTRRTPAPCAFTPSTASKYCGMVKRL